jgi:hypothetical protein
MLQHSIRMSRIIIGILLVLIGIFLSLPLVPGPGLLLVFGGLTVLSSEFEWARRLRDRMRNSVRRLARRPHDG